MVQRPPFDSNSPPPPGGFNPRLGAGDGAERRPDPRFSPRDEENRGPDLGYRGEAGPDPFDRRDSRPLQDSSAGGSGPNRWLLIVGGLVLLAAILFGLSLTRSGPGSDAINSADNEGGEETAAASGPEARCAAPATYDLIKRELFRQAAATRGSAEATYAQMPSYATLRVTNPVLREQDAGLERVTCGGSAALDLPPGLAVVGGRRTLTANIGYSIQPAADGTGQVVTLTGAEGIVVPLATLARVGSTAPAAPVPDAGQQPEPTPAPAPPVAPASPAEPEPQPDPGPVAATAAEAHPRPSFNCARARTRGEIAVCNSTELSDLDRQMAGFYGSAMRGAADRQTRALLERTRSRFLGFRDRCGTDRCIADAYRGRITEIRDIVDGRWRAPN
ncbi:hypothetical protein [Sphingomonas humi]|uniref:DUF1311 domain-containing protein n=1 Tax=Sphingomonas humi TaxID=335630 RepID=A0ABP7SAA5_9SPHN